MGEEAIIIMRDDMKIHEGATRMKMPDGGTDPALWEQNVTRSFKGWGRWRLAQKYLRYYLTAYNGKGHGVHSPFVFDFIIHVLNDHTEYPAYSRIEALRKRLERDSTLLDIEDMGAGSAVRATQGLAIQATRDSGIQVARDSGVPATRQRTVADLARHAAKPKKLGQLLFRIAHYYRPGTIIELGTSLGISGAYLAMGANMTSGGIDKISGGSGKTSCGTDKISGGSGKTSCGTDAKMWTIEGASAIAAVAANNFKSLGLQNLELITGNFDQVLAPVLDRMGPVDLAFVDGNHRREPTLRYFHALMDRATSNSALIFDDIHWSEEMEEAWGQIKKDPRVYLTIDLFFIGIVFLRNEFKVKQDFTIRY